MTRDRLGTIYALIAATGMGIVPIFAKVAYSLGATPMTMLVIRFGLASIILWGYLYWQKEIERVEGKKFFSFALLGVLFGISSLLYFTAITMISVSVATLLIYTAPVFVVIFSVLTGDERMTANILLSLIIASIGLYLILDLSVDTVNLKGILFGLSGGFFYSLFVVGGNRFTAGINPLLVTACSLTATFLFHLCVSLVSNQLSLIQPPLVWGYGVLIALFGSTVGIGFLYKAIQLIGGSKTSIIAIMEPVVAIVLAAILFHERMTLLQLAGGTLIIGAIIIINLTQTQIHREGLEELTEQTIVVGGE